jgi:hypothetical protein
MRTYIQHLKNTSNTNDFMCLFHPINFWKIILYILMKKTQEYEIYILRLGKTIQSSETGCIYCIKFTSYMIFRKLASVYYDQNLQSGKYKPTPRV